MSKWFNLIKPVFDEKKSRPNSYSCQMVFLRSYFSVAILSSFFFFGILFDGSLFLGKWLSKTHETNLEEPKVNLITSDNTDEITTAATIDSSSDYNGLL